MEIIEIDSPAIQQHNAQTARECQIVKEVDRLLRLHRFPSDRVWVDVRFDYGLSEHSSSKSELLTVNGELHGIVELRFHALFVWQDFPTFMEEVVPHELAHAFRAVACGGAGSPEKQHDEAWYEQVLELSPNIEPTAKVKGNFDDRAVRLQKGGIACLCECGGEEAFAVFPNTPSSLNKLQNEELTCTRCLAPYARIKRPEWPEEINQAIEFYESVSEQKLYNSPLTR